MVQSYLIRRDSVSRILAMQMFQALIAVVYRVLSSGHRDRTSVAAGITIVDFQKRPCASARASQSNFLAWWPSAPRLRHLAPFHRCDDAPSSAVKLHFLSGVRTDPH